MTSALRTAVAGGIGACLFFGCAPSAVAPAHGYKAHLWATASSEYAAVTLQTYRAASRMLEPALADSTWTACIEQGAAYESLPPALIVDLDETVLDNRPFQLRMIEEHRDFDIDLWNAWVREKRADVIPGSLEFLHAADDLGIEIFYLTNREHAVEQPTRERMVELGLPIDTEHDSVLTKHERPGWDGGKVTRRKFIAETHRVLLIVGDDLRDFVAVQGDSRERRRGTTFVHAAMWGEKWFMLPNPIYGGWVAASKAKDTPK
ncbi:MAG: 5'-nucleotidase, lipoprotein e(P4) family [Myxococcota bacterium]